MMKPTDAMRPLDFTRSGFNCEACFLRVRWVCPHGVCSGCYCVECHEEVIDSLTWEEF